MEIFIFDLLLLNILLLLSHYYFNLKLKKIMATIDEINAKVDELQSALDAEQVEIKEAIDALAATVADLTAQLGDGGTTEQRQAVIDKLNATLVDLQGTVV